MFLVGFTSVSQENTGQLLLQRFGCLSQKLTQLAYLRINAIKIDWLYSLRFLEGLFEYFLVLKNAKC